MNRRSKTAKYAVRILVMLVAAGLIIVFAARIKPDPSEQTSFRIRYDLTLWYYDDQLTPYLSSFQDDYFKLTGKRTEVVQVPSLDLFDTINKQNVEGTDAPDLYVIDSTKLENAYLSSLAKPNDDPIYSSGAFLPKALEAARYKGTLAAYPLCFNTSFFAWNTDLVDTPPTYMNVFAGKKAPKELLEFDVSNLLNTYFFIASQINLGGTSGDDANAFDLSSKNYTKALKVVQSIGKKSKIDPKLIDEKTAVQDFISEKSAMGIFPVSSLTKLMGSGIPFEISAVPDLAKSLESRALSQTSVICVNPDSDAVSDAQELAAYLSHDHADALFEQCGLMPVVKDAVDDSKLQILQDIYEGSVSLPKLIETENIWENLNMLLTSVWEGEDIERAKSKLNVAVYVALSTRTEQEDR